MFYLGCVVTLEMSHRMSLMPDVPFIKTERDTPTQFNGFPAELHDVVRFISTALQQGDGEDGRRCDDVYYTVIHAANEDETQYIVVGTYGEDVGTSLAFIMNVLEKTPVDTQTFNAVRQVRFVARDHVKEHYALPLAGSVKGCVVFELTINPRLLVTPPNYVSRPKMSVSSGIVSGANIDALMQKAGNDEKDREDLKHVFDSVFTLFSLEADAKADYSGSHYMLHVALTSPFVDVMRVMQLVELCRTGSWHPVVPGSVFPSFVNGERIALCINVLRRKSTTASVVQREPHTPDRSGLRSYGHSARVRYVETKSSRQKGKQSLF